MSGSGGAGGGGGSIAVVEPELPKPRSFRTWVVGWLGCVCFDPKRRSRSERIAIG